MIDSNIEDEANNQTRFVVCSKQPQHQKNLDFTLIAVAPETDRPGLLHDILAILKDQEINMSQIDSRPSRLKLGSYIFYIRLDLPGNDSRYATVASQIEALNSKVARMSA